jgi:hypothetical protein
LRRLRTQGSRRLASPGPRSPTPALRCAFAKPALGDDHQYVPAAQGHVLSSPVEVKSEAAAVAERMRLCPIRPSNPSTRGTSVPPRRRTGISRRPQLSTHHATTHGHRAAPASRPGRLAVSVLVSQPCRVPPLHALRVGLVDVTGDERGVVVGVELRQLRLRAAAGRGPARPAAAAERGTGTTATSRPNSDGRWMTCALPGLLLTAPESDLLPPRTTRLHASHRETPGQPLPAAARRHPRHRTGRLPR